MPANAQQFKAGVESASVDLKSGRNILIHCAGGVGRTGTFSSCILLMLGLSLDEATFAIEAAGSGPETEAQCDLVRMFAER